MKRMLNPKDPRIKPLIPEQKKPKETKDKEDEVRSLTVAPSALFFAYNAQRGPPYHIILDTNFINFSIQNKLDPMKVACSDARMISGGGWGLSI